MVRSRAFALAFACARPSNENVFLEKVTHLFVGVSVALTPATP
jgi:hypothetical protein